MPLDCRVHHALTLRRNARLYYSPSGVIRGVTDKTDLRAEQERALQSLKTE
jgi:hypothetical protein